MLIIFDWDGTLCDSLGKIVRCLQQAAADVSMAIPSDEAVKNIIGLSLQKSIDTVFPGIDKPTFDGLMEAYKERFVADEEPSRFYPSVKETLDGLHAEGHQLAIATGKSRRGMDRQLAEMGLSEYFHGSRCADETASKPDPTMLQHLLKEFETPVAEAIMIGDTAYDMEMAQRIGMRRIAVTYGAHPLEKLLPFEPEACLEAFSHLRKHL